MLGIDPRDVGTWSSPTCTTTTPARSTTSRQRPLPPAGGRDGLRDRPLHDARSMRMPYSAEHVCAMVRERLRGPGRVPRRRSARSRPGVTVHLIGGHAKGIQCVRAPRRADRLVLASDATHYYENCRRQRPFIIAHDVEADLRGYDRLRDLAGGGLDRIVPGRRSRPAHGRFPSRTRGSRGWSRASTCRRATPEGPPSATWGRELRLVEPRSVQRVTLQHTPLVRPVLPPSVFPIDRS